MNDNRQSTVQMRKRMRNQPSASVMQGRYYVYLMLEAAEISGLPLDQIQFNFCLKDAAGKPLPSDSTAIQQAINDFMSSMEGLHLIHTQLKPEELKALKQVNLPEDSAKLKDYVTTLKVRGESFAAAAKTIIENSNGTMSPEKKKAYYLQLEVLEKIYKKNLDSGPKLTPQKAQAYYDAYIDVVKSIIKNALPNSDDDMLTKHLQNAETLCNITERKAQFTFSGRIGLGNSVHLQMDEPRTFS